MDLGHSQRDNPINWALTLGRISGIRVRLHLFFILWITVELFRNLGAEGGGLGFWAVVTGLLFSVVLIHEFGRCYGARRVGGDADDILMWPLGGLASVQAPMTPRAQFITTAAGPMVNVIFCTATATMVMLLAGASAIPLNPFNPFAGIATTRVLQWGPLDWLLAFWWVNYLILLFNLLPIFPMDGGRLLQTIIWKYSDFRHATMTATFVGMIGAIGFGLVGIVSERLILVGIAFFGYFTCWQQRQMLKSGMLEADNEWGYDFSKGHGAFGEQSERKPSWLARRRADKQARRAALEHHRRAERQEQIDRILDKVHREGVQSLTAKEKKLLQDETDRKQHI